VGQSFRLSTQIRQGRMLKLTTAKPSDSVCAVPGVGPMGEYPSSLDCRKPSCSMTLP